MVIAIGGCVALDLACRALLPMSPLVVRTAMAREYLRAEPVPDIQIFGDSVMERALIADALSGGGALQVRNDSVPASRPPMTYFLVREEFAAGRLPRAIVYSHIPRTFDDAFTDRLAGTFVDWKEMPQVYWSSTHPTEALYGTLGRFSYLLMHRKWLKDFVLSGDYSYFTIPESEYAYVPATADRSVANYLADPAGYQESVNSFDGLITDDREQEPFSVASENDHYFRETLALAKAYGVPVFWLTPPASETLARVDEVNGYYDDLADYLAPFVQSGELIVLQLRPEVYADKNFTDSVHPTATATLRYSCTMRRYASVIADNIGVEIEWRLPKDQTSSLSGAMIRSGDALAARDWTSRCFDSSTQTSAVVDASLDVGNQP